MKPTRSTPRSRARSSSQRQAGRTAAAAAPAFHDAAARSLERLRASTLKLLESLPGGIQRATDLRRQLGLDAALAWQIHTLATASDPLSAGRVVPKNGAMERFFAAARSQRIPETVAQQAETAYADFERVVAEHAGDRATFDAMLSALAPGDGASLQRIRRAAFKANAAVWGVSVRCALNCVVFRERPTGEHDCLSIRGRVGLQRLQQDAVIGIYATGRTWGGGSCPPEGATNVSVDICELIEPHCSRPIPRIERIAMADGTTRDFLQLEGLGRASEVSLYWRNVALNFPGGSRTPPHGCTSPCLESAEMMVVDLLVPRGWADPGTLSAWVTPESSRFPTGPSGPAPQRLPFEGDGEYLGTRLASLYTRHAPSYADLVAGELERLGWAGETFDIFRCAVPYPVLFSSIHICVAGTPAYPPTANR